jgi:hypothetical protein
MLLGETGIGTGGAGFDAGETGLDAATDGIGMARLLRMRAEHGSDGDGGHGFFPSQRACPTTLHPMVGSVPEKVPHLSDLRKSSRNSHAASDGVQAMSLTTASRFKDPDQAFVTLIEARRGLSEREAAELDAKLVLILANHIGDIDVLREAIAFAKRAETEG